MRTYILSFLFILSGAINGTMNAQSTSTTFKVWGNCGMCKKNIETAATTNGATSASWNQKTKMLTVSFDAQSSSVQKIQSAIADAGYDNEGVTAPDAAYNKLHGCCQYDRKSESSGSTEKGCCVKDGKCKGGKACCKKAGNKDCCKTASCEKDGGCCADCKSKEAGCCSGKSKKECKGKCGHRR